MKNILIFSFCIAIFGCNETAQKTFTVSGTINDPDISEARLETSDSIYPDAIESNKFTFTLPILTEGYVYLEIGRKIPLYVKPCDSIFVSFNKGNEIDFSGKGFEESKFLDNKRLLIKKQGFDDPRMIDIALFSGKPEKFQTRIDSIKQIRLNQLYDFKKQHPGLSETFFNIEQQLIAYFEINQLFAYPGFHEMLTHAKPELPAGFYDFTKRMETNKSELFSFNEYQSAIRSFLNFKTTTFSEKYFLAKQLLGDTAFFEKIMYDEFNSYINFNGIDDIDSVCVDFIQAIGNAERKNSLKRRYDDWKKLAGGEKAPDFEIKDENGYMVRLSDFKGKYVYIDCWSSYCGPCIAEMPAMKRLAEDLKGRNIVFISVSADQDKERWLNKVREFNIKTINLCTEGVKHKFNDDYNAKAFPRYILIDDKGYIIDATADKPSLIKGELERLL
jgi:thiol-disulfide isomerase/thioredoxin